MNHDSGQYRDAQTDDSRQTAAFAILCKAITITNFFATLVLIAGMIIDHNSVTVSTVVGIGYFVVSTPIVITVLAIVITGTLRDVAVEFLRQRTAQKQIENNYQIQRLEIIDVDVDKYKVSTQPTQLPWTRNYVPAIPAPLSEEYHK